MKFTWDNILAPDESIQKEFSFSKTYQRFVLLSVIITSIVVFFAVNYIGILLFILGGIYWLYVYMAKHYAFTNKRIVLVDSFVGKSIISIDYNQITDIEIEQSAIEQFVNWGTIIINTAGTHTPEIRLGFIDHPESVKQNIDQIRDRNKPQVIIAAAQS